MMPVLRRARYALWSLAGLCLVVAAYLGVWAIVQGPVTVYRIVVNGTTTVDDYKLYPARPLTASPRPHRFQETPRPELERLPVPGFAGSNLGDFLARTDTIAFVAIQGDRLLFERYFHGRDRSSISQAFSTSKSILSFLVGAAIGAGLIGSVDDAVTRYVPELAAAGFGKVRIADLLQMKSSMDYVENDNPFGRHVRFNYTNHLESEILALRVKPVPDDRFIYKSGENALLGLILKRALKGKSIAQYTQERLWDSLGMEYGGLWSLDREGGMEKTWCCLSAAARDFAKIGVLYRDGGMWEGKALVSKKWIDDSTRQGAYSAEQWKRANVSPAFWNYGYQWWLVDQARGDFTSRGKDGQFIYVDPARGVVLVRLGTRNGMIDGKALRDSAWMALFQVLADKMETL